MGMFDNVRASYKPLGPQFCEITCQTKTMDQHGLGGSLSYFWIDPKGQVWSTVYRGTHDFVVLEKDDPDYNEKSSFLNFKWVPTGKHGKVEPYKLTGYVTIYPETFDGPWEDWPEVRLHIVDGVVKDFKFKQKGEPNVY